MLFVVRTFFIKILGEENLGLSGLFTNILNILSVTELGIGTIISFSLYKPLSEKDTKKINALMNFYKKFYYLAGIIIIVLGILKSFNNSSSQSRVLIFNSIVLLALLTSV